MKVLEKLYHPDLSDGSAAGPFWTEFWADVRQIINYSFRDDFLPRVQQFRVFRQQLNDEFFESVGDDANLWLINDEPP